MADRPTTTTIEAAEAVLMAALKVGPDQALELLVRAARREDLPLHDIAARVVALHHAVGWNPTPVRDQQPAR